MEKKSLPKRRSANTMKPNNDVTPAKLKKTEVPLDKLTKHKLIEKYKELEEAYSKLIATKEKNEYENKVLKDRLEESESKLNSQSEVHSVQTQTKYEVSELKFNCDECIHTTNGEKALRWHIFHAHNKGNPEIPQHFSCNNCKEKFTHKQELMVHLKNEHKDRVAVCKYYKEGNCFYSSETCWFLHPNEQSHSKYNCNFCDSEFQSKYEIMKHRKEEHSQKVQMCRNFKNNSCKFNNDCWYNHKHENQFKYNFGKQSHLENSDKEMDKEESWQA